MQISATTGGCVCVVLSAMRKTETWRVACVAHFLPSYFKFYFKVYFDVPKLGTNTPPPTSDSSLKHIERELSQEGGVKKTP